MIYKYRSNSKEVSYIKEIYFISMKNIMLNICLEN